MMCDRIRGRHFAGPEDHGVTRIFGQRWNPHLREQCFAQGITLGCHGVSFCKATVSEAISSDKKKPSLWGERRLTRFAGIGGDGAKRMFSMPPDARLAKCVKSHIGVETTDAPPLLSLQLPINKLPHRPSQVMRADG